MRPHKDRMTLRLPSTITEVLRKEADRKDLPVNALVTKILHKNIAIDAHLQLTPKITIVGSIFTKIIDKVNEHELQEIAKEVPSIVKSLFIKSGFQYNLDNIIDNYLPNEGKYCEWYDFKHEIINGYCRLVFQTRFGSKWIKFLATYVRSILESVKVHIKDECVEENVLIFEFAKQQEK